MSIQDFGEKFDLSTLFRAREVARDITYELATLIKPGMIEEDAHRIYKELCQRHKVERQWHPPKLRFGPNTVKNFRDVSDSHKLQEEDIFFIDIGPVIKGHEADYGEPFAMGSDYEYKKIVEASKTIFNEVARHWKKTRMSGVPLYEYAKKKAEAHGYLLSMNSDGHRIGDFPHHVFFKGGITECEEIVVPNAWILEIHLLEPKKRFGAFFEDILTDQAI